MNIELDDANFKKMKILSENLQAIFSKEIERVISFYPYSNTLLQVFFLPFL